MTGLECKASGPSKKATITKPYCFQQQSFFKYEQARVLTGWGSSIPILPLSHVHVYFFIGIPIFPTPKRTKRKEAAKPNRNYVCNFNQQILAFHKKIKAFSFNIL